MDPFIKCARLAAHQTVCCSKVSRKFDSTCQWQVILIWFLFSWPKYKFKNASSRRWRKSPKVCITVNIKSMNILVENREWRSWESLLLNFQVWPSSSLSQVIICDLLFIAHTCNMQCPSSPQSHTNRTSVKLYACKSNYLSYFIFSILYGFGVPVCSVTN